MFQWNDERKKSGTNAIPFEQQHAKKNDEKPRKMQHKGEKCVTTQTTVEHPVETKPKLGSQFHLH